MKKTVNINISGIVFHIEEEAYTKLQDYLFAIEKNFSDEAERLEIMRDIESRIAELFQTKNTNSKEVITYEDVQDVINIMGNPEDYVNDEFYDENTKSEHSNFEKEETQKRLYRDKDNAQIGGVCSGIGAYIGIDPVIIRVIFVIMFLAGLSGFIIYIILLFVIPEAKTTNEKLRMKGKPININTIKDSAKDFKKDFENGEVKQKFGKTLSSAFERGVKSSSKFFNIFSKVVGLGFLLTGIFALIVLIGIFIGDGGIISFWGERQTLNLTEGMDILYNSSFQSNLTFFSIILVLFIPIISLIYYGIRILLNIKTKIKYLSLSLTVLWIFSISVLSFTSILLGLEFKDEASITKAIEINAEIETLEIYVNDDDVFSNNLNQTENQNISDLIDVRKDNIYLGYPKLIIIENPTDTVFNVEIHKSSRGLNQKEAIMNSELISFDYELNNSKLYLSPYMSIGRNDKFRGQKIEIIVRVPKGKSVYLGENIERILHPISTNTNDHIDKYQYSKTEWTNRNNKIAPSNL